MRDTGVRHDDIDFTDLNKQRIDACRIRQVGNHGECRGTERTKGCSNSCQFGRRPPCEHDFITARRMPPSKSLANTR